MYTPELQARIATLRARAADGTATIEEMREAVAIIRQGRTSAAIASERSKGKKAKPATPDADDMLNEI